MAAIVQRLERLIVVQDVVGSNPTSRPIKFLFSFSRNTLLSRICVNHMICMVLMPFRRFLTPASFAA